LLRWKAFIKNKEDRAKRAATRSPEQQIETQPSLEIKAYAGSYENAELGRIVI